MSIERQMQILLIQIFNLNEQILKLELQKVNNFKKIELLKLKQMTNKALPPATSPTYFPPISPENFRPTTPEYAESLIDINSDSE